VTNGGSSLTVTGVSASQANDLGASYQLYTHTKTNETIVHTVGYSPPAALHRHVQTVAPMTYFSFPLTQWQTPRKRSSGAAARLVKSASGEPATVLSSRDDVRPITPAVLHWMYSTFAYVPSAMGQNKLGIAGYKGDYPSPADLDAFMGKYRSDIDETDATITVVLVNGGKYDPSQPGIEANLDLQITEGMAYPTPHTFYSTGCSQNRDVYLAWLDTVLRQPSISQTITTSYSNYEKEFPMEYAVRVCFLFAQLGTRGASGLFSSGDDGAGEGDCKTNDGTVQFTPVFPATCACGIFFSARKQYTSAGTGGSPHGHAFAGPYVTTVGGATGYMPEIAARRGRLLELLSAPGLPTAGRIHLPPGPRQSVLRPLQVRLLP